MHKAQKIFCELVFTRFADHALNKKVLDVGSRNINGTNKYLFRDCDYLGLDSVKGDNVDIVTPIHLFKSQERFDVVLSTEMLEHDPFWQKSIERMVDLTKKEGLLVITCANIHRPKHGESWSSGYYRNINWAEFKIVIKPFRNFRSFGLESMNYQNDLYFWGIKK